MSVHEVETRVLLVESDNLDKFGLGGFRRHGVIPESRQMSKSLNFGGILLSEQKRALDGFVTGRPQTTLVLHDPKNRTYHRGITETKGERRVVVIEAINTFQPVEVFMSESVPGSVVVREIFVRSTGYAHIAARNKRIADGTFGVMASAIHGSSLGSSSVAGDAYVFELEFFAHCMLDLWVVGRDLP